MNKSVRRDSDKNDCKFLRFVLESECHLKKEKIQKTI